MPTTYVQCQQLEFISEVRISSADSLDFCPTDTVALVQPCQIASVEDLFGIVLCGNDVFTTVGCLPQANALCLLLIVADVKLVDCDWLDVCQDHFTKAAYC
eukprot:87957-Amphidinium_carterae.1